MPFELPARWKVSELSSSINADFSHCEGRYIDSVSSLNEATKGSLTFYTGYADKANKALSTVQEGCVVCISKEVSAVTLRDDIGYIITDYPRFVFLSIVEIIMREHSKPEFGISPFASVSEAASIHDDVSIGAFVSVGPNSIINRGCVLNPGAHIGSNVILKDHVRIGPNTTIGVDGQASERSATGQRISLHHFARVIVGEKTTIGSNSVIVRGSLQDTLIGRRCNIGHRVSIGHNCTIGDDCFISAGATLAGSVELEPGVWVGPNSSILNKLKVGSEAVIGIGSVVVRAVECGKFVAGNPARELRQTEPGRYNRINE